MPKIYVSCDRSISAALEETPQMYGEVQYESMQTAASFRDRAPIISRNALPKAQSTFLRLLTAGTAAASLLLSRRSLYHLEHCSTNSCKPDSRTGRSTAISFQLRQVPLRMLNQTIAIQPLCRNKASSVVSREQSPDGLRKSCTCSKDFTCDMFP